MIRISIFIGISISLFLGVSKVYGQSGSLEEYIQTALQNNPGLQADQGIYEAEITRIDQVNTLADPQAGLNIFGLPVETRVGPQRVGLSVSQQLPWFGTLKAKGNMAEARAEISRFQFEDRRLNLVYSVHQVYYQAYELEAAIRLTTENLERLRMISNLATIKFEADKVGLADALRIDLEINEIEQQLALLKDSRRPLQQSFAQLLNQSTPGPIDLPDTLTTEPWLLGRDSMRSRILAQHPSLKRFDAQAKMYALQEEVARLNGKPGFSVGLGYVNVGKRQDAEVPKNGRDIVQAMAGIRIPLYRRKYDAQFREAELRGEASKNMESNLANGLLTEMEKRYRDLTDGLRRIELYRQQIRIAGQTLDVLIGEYSVAGNDFEELLRMDRNILNYSLNLEKARVDQNTAVAHLIYLLGL